MRIGSAVCLFVLFASAGCVSQNGNLGTSSFLHPLRPGNSFGSDGILLEISLIEREAGDDYINREIWKHVDQLVVDFEQKERLEANGFRVGRLLGSPPVGFQTLLQSPRFCANPFMMQTSTGRTRHLVLSPVLQHDDYEVDLPSGKKSFAFDQIRYLFDVKMVRLDEGKTKLTFIPKVETGENALPFQHSEDEGWSLRVQRPHRKYEELQWEVELAAGHYLVVGGKSERPKSVGHRAFFEDGAKEVQRLLVIRNVTPANSAANEWASKVEEQPSLVPPLAYQAGVSAVRAKHSAMPR